MRGATYYIYYILESLLFLSTLPVRGATKDKDKKEKRVKRFLSTLPVRGATILHKMLRYSHNISIHAPREGSDWTLLYP